MKRPKSSAAGMVGALDYAVGIAGWLFVAGSFPRARHAGFLKKLSLVCLGVVIVCTLGGRRYILNTIEARNPLYPFPVSIFNYYLEGRAAFEEEEKWAMTRAHDAGTEKLNLLEREYRKLCYLPLAAGPKYLLFLIAALMAPFCRPRHIPKRCWYFLFIMWLVPILILYTAPTAAVARGPGEEVIESRYFFLYIALFTIQGLVILQKYFLGDRVAGANCSWQILGRDAGP